MPSHKKQCLVEAAGILKAAVTYWKEHPEQAIIAVSLHDEKPVYLMSSVAEIIQWNKKVKKVWNSEEAATIECFRLSMIDDCNHNMGSADIVDQLWNAY